MMKLTETINDNYVSGFVLDYDFEITMWINDA